MVEVAVVMVAEVVVVWVVARLPLLLMMEMGAADWLLRMMRPLLPCSWDRLSISGVLPPPLPAAPCWEFRYSPVLPPCGCVAEAPPSKHFF